MVARGSHRNPPRLGRRSPMSAGEQQLRARLAQEREKRTDENAEAAKIAQREREREAAEAVKAFQQAGREAKQSPVYEPSGAPERRERRQQRNQQTTGGPKNKNTTNSTLENATEDAGQEPDEVSNNER